VNKKLLNNCRLYAITAFRPEMSYETMIQQMIAGGADIIQFREKTLPDRQRLVTARKLAAICRRKKVFFIVNDRTDIVRLSGADGVHLGENDIGIKDARLILGPGKIIGYSVSDNRHLAKKAEKESADYVAVGALWATPTKPEKKPVGLKIIREIKNQIKIPVVAIGGIDKSNVLKVLKSGADIIAVVRAVALARDIRCSGQELKNIIVEFENRK
jgi:thiamine-phosphate pyrophosphorylase